MVLSIAPLRSLTGIFWKDFLIRYDPGSGLLCGLAAQVDEKLCILMLIGLNSVSQNLCRKILG
ncbi:hypothetical protein NUACC21_10840 [Scytonema sp. NUACC21]